MKYVFSIIFFVFGMALFAEPAEYFREAMGWFSKNENDLISAGFKMGIETDLSRAGLGIQRHYFLIEDNTRFAIVTRNGNIQNVEFDTINNYFRNRSEALNEFEKVRILAQSLNARLDRNTTNNWFATTVYKAVLQNTFEITIRIDNSITGVSNEMGISKYSIDITSNYHFR
jgi:hypothetical protein